MHERDNVAIVANDGGLAAGSVLPSGLVLRDRVPQGHKVALVDIPAGAPVLRYGIAIGHALKPIPAGSWVHERLLKMPAARGFEDLPIATVKAPPLPPLDQSCLAEFAFRRNPRRVEASAREMKPACKARCAATPKFRAGWPVMVRNACWA